MGDFDFSVDTTKLITLDIERNELLTQLVGDPAFGSEFAALAVDRVLIDGNPEWRSTASLGWRKGEWGAGVSARYVSGFLDTSADAGIDGNFWRVSEALRVNTYLDYRLKDVIGASTRFRLGVNNVFDEAPPLADEAIGWNTEYHSVKGREFYVQIRASF